MVLGVFSNRSFAENAIMDLEAVGFNPRDISIVMRDQTEAADVAHSTGAHVAEGAMSGIATGGVVGGLAGLLIGIGAIAVPGIGGLLIGGPLAAALGLSGAAATTASGALTGALAGGLIGALMGLGVSEDDAKFYEERVRDGAILLAIPEMGRRDEVIDILEGHQAENVRFIADSADSAYSRRPLYDRDRDEYQYMGYAGMKGGEIDDETAVSDDRSVLEQIKDRVRGKRAKRVR